MTGPTSMFVQARCQPPEHHTSHSASGETWIKLSAASGGCRGCQCFACLLLLLSYCWLVPRCTGAVCYLVFIFTSLSSLCSLSLSTAALYDRTDQLSTLLMIIDDKVRKRHSIMYSMYTFVFAKCQCHIVLTLSVRCVRFGC